MKPSPAKCGYVSDKPDTWTVLEILKKLTALSVAEVRRISSNFGIQPLSSMIRYGDNLVLCSLLQPV